MKVNPIHLPSFYVNCSHPVLSLLAIPLLCGVFYWYESDGYCEEIDGGGMMNDKGVRIRKMNASISVRNGIASKLTPAHQFSPSMAMAIRDINLTCFKHLIRMERTIGH